MDSYYYNLEIKSYEIYVLINLMSHLLVTVFMTKDTAVGKHSSVELHNALVS